MPTLLRAQALVPLSRQLSIKEQAAPGGLWGTGGGRGHGAVSTVPAASSMSAFHPLSFPPKAADDPAYNGFRAPDASLQAAASRLQGQCVAAPRICSVTGALSTSPTTRIIPRGRPRASARLRAAERHRATPRQHPQCCRLVLSIAGCGAELFAVGEGMGNGVGDARDFAGIPRTPVQAERAGLAQPLIPHHLCRHCRSGPADL